MKTKTALRLTLFVVLICVSSCADAHRDLRTFFKEDNAMDVTDFSIFYDINTNETIRRMLPRPWYRPGWRPRLPFTAGGCSCEALQCLCCTGIRLNAFDFDRKTCTSLTYEPTESLINMSVKMNNETIFMNTYSARNPPPLCVPLPVPYLPPGLADMCVRLYDVSVVGQRLHVCLDIDARLDKAPVLVLHFDCMDMGADGVGLSKPGGGAASLVPGGDTDGATSTDTTQLAADIFDPVYESNTTVANKTNIYLII